MEAREAVVSPTPASQAGGMASSHSGSLMESHAVGGGVLPQVMNMAINMSIERSIGGDLVKKKRGRPRKYGGTNETNTNNNMTLALTPFYSPTSPSEFSPKRGRGRPPGSGKRQLLAALGEWVANSAGGNFTPHVVTISAGEDVATKILSFSQKGPRAICILSANGAISNVTLRQPGSSGGTLTYEGRFEILSLSGSFTLTDNGGVRSRTGGISVSLAGPDGRVVGGGVAGLLLAASPIQVVVGSFMPGSNREQKKKPNPESLVASPFLPGSVAITTAQPISHMIPDDSCATPSSAMPSQNHSNTENNTGHRPNQNSGSLNNAGWSGSQSTTEERPSPDINLCLPGE